MTYRVHECRGYGCDVTARGIPFNAGNTVVLARSHKLEIGLEILSLLIRSTLEVKIPEVKVEGGLRTEGGNDYETALWRPVDAVARLLVKSAHMLEVADGVALGFFGSKESNGRLRCSRASGELAGGDEAEAVALGLPSEVDDGLLDGIDDFYRNALLPNAENLKVCGHGLSRLGLLDVNLDANIGGV